MRVSLPLRWGVRRGLFAYAVARCLRIRPPTAYGMHTLARSQARWTAGRNYSRSRGLLNTGLHRMASIQQRQLGVRHMSAWRAVVRMAPTRLIAVPAIFAGVGVTGYERVKKQVQLPDLPFQERLDHLKESVADFFGTIKSLARAQTEKLHQPLISEPPTPSSGPEVVASLAAAAQAVDESPAADSSGAEGEEKESTEGAGWMALPLMLGGRIAHAEAQAPAADNHEDVHAMLYSLQEQLDEAYTRHQAEIIEERDRLQAEIRKLIQENEHLRTSYLQLHQQVETGDSGHFGMRKKSAIEMYSDILDLLSKYDKDFSVQDNLPRVVVVGDQSAGKTSVLEMIAQARMFPRGHGEMMTRAPIQVTLTEGPKRSARFADGKKEYDLNNESDLKRLRAEIKKRMIDSVSPGDTVSTSTISLNVTGPGLPRMVLVDLPGVIGHVTAGMADRTKDDITSMCIKHMSNPNAIILCVQDGSVDAERSNVADLVSNVDPKGKRTVFVMTKVDVAEAHNTAPGRVRSIMEGRLFRMNALGYYAVVTGKGGTDESIGEIKEYEEEFFRTSKLFREGALRPHQTTTSNLARAVSSEFWKRVRESVMHQAELIRADLNQMELEWRNSYKGRMMTRDELFQLGKHEILESVAHFGNISPREWEALLQDKIWSAVSEDVITEIYINAARSQTTDFKTRVDVQLLDWARKDLPVQCVDIARTTFIDEFERIVRESVIDTMADSQEVFSKLKDMLVQRSREHHAWHPQVIEKLRVIQINSLEDEVVTDPGDWQLACDFMSSKLQAKDEELQAVSRGFFGPEALEQWTCWRSRDPQQARHAYIRHELTSSFDSLEKPKSLLDYDDIVTVRNNIKSSRKVDVTDQEIVRVYEVMYASDFINRSLRAAAFCRHMYKTPEDVAGNAPNGLACKDVAMFWRMQEMLRVSAKTLRQQVMYHKARLEQEVKAELDAVSQDEGLKRQLIQGPRVDLAEQVEVTRHISHELDNFIRVITNAGTSSS